jgi:hypothetical protein
MNWMSETRKALSTALSRVILPEILLPSLIIGGGANVFPTLMVLGRLGPAMRSPAQARESAGEMLLMLLFTVLVLPAVSSGLYAVSRAVVMYGRAGWKDFWSGLGTYWWRIVGLFSLMTLAVILVFVALGFDRGSFLFDAIPTPDRLFAVTAGSLVLLLVYVAARYFLTPVLPAMVIEQVPALKSIELGFRFAWRNASVVAPVVGVDLVGTWLLGRIESATAETIGYEYGLTFGAVFPYVAMALVSVLVSAFFRLLHLGIYYDRLPPPVVVTGPSPDGESTSETEEGPESPPAPESPPERPDPQEPSSLPEPPGPQQG